MTPEKRIKPSSPMPCDGSMTLPRIDPAAGAVPAWWANYFFGTNNSAIGSMDTDNDGYSNYAEFVLGTDPTDPNSRLNFNVAPGAGGAIAVTFSPFQGGRFISLLPQPISKVQDGRP